MGVHERATTSPRSRPRALAVAVLALLGGAVTTAPAAEGGAAPVPPPVPAPLVVRDLRYGPAPEHLADLHLPTAGGNRGVIVLVHGGGFVRGSRGELFRTAAPLVRQLDRGFALVDVEYRLTDGERHTFPDAVRDVSRAVEWVRRHGRRHGLDPSTVIVAGASAGGTIATLVGVGTKPTPGTRLPRTPRVDGWVAVSGIHDFAERAGASRFGATWLGGNPGAAALADASPVTHLDRDDPPGYVVHGDRDTVVPVSQAVLAVGRAATVGASVEHDLVDDGPGSCRWHFPACGMDRAAFDRWVDRVAGGRA